MGNGPDSMTPHCTKLEIWLPSPIIAPCWRRFANDTFDFRTRI
jgi:hypothetical protein